MNFNKKLNKNKINILIFINNNSGGNSVLRELSKLPFLNLIILEKKINKIFFIIKIIYYIFKFKNFKNYKILCSDPLLAILLYLSNIKFIRFVQSDDLILFNKRIPFFLNYFYKIFYLKSLSQNIIVNSDFVKNNLLALKKDIKILGKCRPGSNFKFYNNKKEYELVYIYREAPWKRSDSFIHIINLLDRMLKYKINVLLINFNIKLTTKYKHISFNYLPWLEPYELNKQFSKCKIILSTSKNEGFGMPFLEAMRSGCISITPEKGGTSEFVINNFTGFTYNDKNYKEFIAKKIINIIDNYNEENIKKIIDNSLKYTQKFTWENSRLEFESLSKKYSLN